MLTLKPCGRDLAVAFILKHHRHRQPSQGYKFALAALDAAELVRGVVMVGRPAARALDDGWTAQVLRCCTDGCFDACSFLMAASWRVCLAMGYRKLITYTLPAEGGASLKALRQQGWRLVNENAGAAGRSWAQRSKSRPRTNDDAAPKHRWKVTRC